MYTSRQSMRTAVWLLFAIATQAQQIIDNLSFGHKESSFSPSHRTVEYWHMSGEQHTPDLLSDRIILTPPYPGSKRGAIWSDNTMPNAEWVAELHFRASGQERSGGNMQIWYAKQGNTKVGTNSLYTVDKFDGLLLEVDQYSGHGGTIRGFLNDDTKSFKGHHNVDSLSFGQCDYSYRNLGRFSGITLKQTGNGFEVLVDGAPCFKSDQVLLPTGYEFGVTAASAENPDSFELAKFTVSTLGVAREEPWGNQNQQANQQAMHQQNNYHSNRGGSASPPSSGNNADSYPDAKPESIKSQEEQFADLHNRLQGLQHQMNALFGEVRDVYRGQADFQKDLLDRIAPLSDRSYDSKQVQARIEDRVNEIKKDIEGKDYKEILQTLQQSVSSSHSNMMQSLPLAMDHLITKNGPKLTTFVFIVIAVQIMLIGGYIVYKRRMKSMPKKYL